MMLEFKIYLGKKLIQRSVVSKKRVTIGRSSEEDLVLQDQHVSRLHAVIEKRGDAFWLEDKSTNGVLLDGKRISSPAILPLQCRIDIYPFEIDCIQIQEAQTLKISEGEIKGSLPEADIQEPPLRPGDISYHFDFLVGESPRMHQVYQLIRDVASSPATVLIRGDHGTGKELVARAIHGISRRSGRPFIAVNSAAIPLELIESELFGYEKGAFTGAHIAKKGKIEEAKGGTLFLDEIGELSQAAQAKLLRFLQERVIMRLGGASEIPVDVRVISATNKDLEQAVRDGIFRPDLYYRIKVVQISLPPLRDRPEDIPLLVSHLLKELVQEMGLSSDPLLTADAMEMLKKGKWPGNIRQLKNLLYSALVRAKPPYVLDLDSLHEEQSPLADPAEEEEENPIDRITKQLLLDVLEKNHWDTAKAAEALKVSRGTIYYKLKKYGINPREVLKRGYF